MARAHKQLDKFLGRNKDEPFIPQEKLELKSVTPFEFITHHTAGEKL